MGDLSKGNDTSHSGPPEWGGKTGPSDQVCDSVEGGGDLCVPLFRDHQGGFRVGLSDNAGRLIPAPGPAFLADQIEVTADNTLQTALPRDVSLYRTYAYMVTNTGDVGNAEVTLRANGIHKLSTATVATQQTVVLTPNPILPYPAFDELVEVTYTAAQGTANLIIRFTGQLEGALNGLPCAPFAWGNNASGQLGDSSSDNDRLRPVQVLRLAGVKAMAGGNAFSTGLLSDGTVWAWGDNSTGQLGNGTSTARLVPVQVSGVSRIAAIASGDRFSLALRSDGGVFGWGSNSDGQLGDGTVTPFKDTPVRVLGVGGSGFLRNIKSIAAGDHFSLAMNAKGSVFAWGSNDSGQLGNNNPPTDSPVPVQVLGVGGKGFLHDIVSVSAGDNHAVALRSDGTVLAWGNNSDGQLGNNNAPTDSPVPVQVLGIGGVGILSGVKAIVAGEFFNLALLYDGTVVAWGDNANGQLGNNNAPTDSPVPVQVLGPGGVGFLRHIVALAGGNRHSLALSADGRVYAWGDNDDGQLGNGTTAPSSTPVLVGTISDVVAIGAGSFHSLAVVR